MGENILTNREKDVFLLLIKNKSTKEIADILNISEKTVRNHISNTMQKLGCKGMTLVQNNELGQDIKHFHLHLTPRYDNDLLAHSFNKDILLNVAAVFDKVK